MSTGYTTYLFAFCMGLAACAKMLGWLSQEEFATLEGFLTAGTLTALRAGVKSGK